MEGVEALEAKPKILCLSSQIGGIPDWDDLRKTCDMVGVQTAVDALTNLQETNFDGVLISTKYFEDPTRIGSLLQNEQVLEGMPDGVVMMDETNTILWANNCMTKWAGRENLVGLNFYTSLSSPEILGPDFCPFHTALTSRKASGSTLRTEDNRYYQVHAAPVICGSLPPLDCHHSRRHRRSVATAKVGSHS